MIIGKLRDRNPNSITYQLVGEISYSPLFEMMASMHVICNPTHHLGRTVWLKRVEENVSPLLIQKIRELSVITDEWLIPIDITFERDFIEYDLEEALMELRHVSLARWNHLFEPYGMRRKRDEITKMLDVLEEYASSFFLKELRFLEPLIIRELKKIYESWKSEGIATSLTKIHDRLKITEDEAIYFKRKEYHYPWSKVKLIQYTGSSFCSPHLIMGVHKSILSVVKNIVVETAKEAPSKELVDRYAALADGTRLHILKLVKRYPQTTKHLAEKLEISEAAVSKQLKLLYNAGFLTKNRERAYVYYSLNETMLEHLTYWIFEYL